MSTTREHPGAARRTLAYQEKGFVPVSCLIADLIRMNDDVVPASSKTDLSGAHGEPEVFTEWAVRHAETTVLIEHRWPGFVQDAYRCEHYALGESR